MSLFFIAGAGNCSSVNSLLREGNSDYEKKAYDKAFESYAKVLAKSPKNGKAFYNAGNALYKLEDYEKARQSYEAAAPDKKVSKDALFNTGNAFFREQKYKEAIDCYKKALLVSPSDDAAKHNLEVALRQKNNPPPKQCPKKDPNKKNQDKQDNKNQQQQRKNNSGMSKEDAERIMQAAKEKEQGEPKPEPASVNRSKKGSRPPVEEDW